MAAVCHIEFLYLLNSSCKIIDKNLLNVAHKIGKQIKSGNCTFIKMEVVDI